jgi:hypothetical protein
MEKEKQAQEVCNGTANIIQSSENADYNDFANLLFEKINKKLKTKISKDAIIDHETEPFRRLYINDNDEEYTVRMWDITNIKNGVKVRYTLFKEV